GQPAVHLDTDGWRVTGVEGRSCGQAVIPAVLADSLEEHVERADPVLLDVVSAGLGHGVGEVAFQQRPVDVGKRVDTDQGQEVTEPGQGIDSGPGRADTQPRRQAQPAPSFAQITQPGMRDAVEPQPGARTRATAGPGDAGQPVQPPDIPGIFDLPAGSVAQ